MDEIVYTENLTKVFGDHVKAVDHVSFTVHEGEIFGFLGPNGAGKTTTINMLTTLIKPTEGRASIAGFDVVEDAAKVRSLVGLVPQELTVDDELTGMENMLLQARLYHVPIDIAKARIDEVLGLVGLRDAANRYVKTYSGGMRKRLELAEGLIHHPQILFMDEPTLGLDVQTRAIMWDYIKELNEDHNVTIFLTTHYLEEADILCDRLAIIDRGKIVAMGKPSELKDQIGGDIIQISIAEDSLNLEDLLTSLPYVKEVRRVDDLYRLKVSRGEEVLPKVLMEILERKIDIKTVSLIKPTLDQVFLEYTGRSLRDAHATKEEARRRMSLLRRLRG
ncbi:MAG: ATP-binding cassette domain-containing protein [Candidatus Geothermarchaeales archaeon]